MLFEGEMVYPELNIEVWGDHVKETEDAFKFAVEAIIKNIYLEDEEKLNDKAKKIKLFLNSILQPAA